MKKRIACLLAALLLTLLLPIGALADRQYLMDSDSRKITAEELWDWDRESLSFMFNEIFARHGFTFDVGGKFYNWFNAQPWYQAIEKVSDRTAYDRTTELEWENYRTIKQVIEDMKAVDWPYRKPKGSDLLSWTDYQPPGQWSLTGFRHVNVKGEQSLPVYSAPDAASWRGANGKASVSTNGAIWAAGWENGWLLVFYETNSGGLRVGYVEGARMTGKIDFQEWLAFARVPVQTAVSCTLTDDPLKQGTAMATVPAGTTVTYLTTMTNQNGMAWDYVETTAAGKTARGFIPAGCLTMAWNDEPEEGAFGIK